MPVTEFGFETQSSGPRVPIDWTCACILPAREANAIPAEFCSNEVPE